MQIAICFRKEKLICFEIGYHVLNRTVSARLACFEMINKCFAAKSLRIAVEDSDHTSILLPTGRPGKLWPEKKDISFMLGFWVSGLSKLKAIEEYYDIEFKLEPISGQDNVLKIYESVDVVYDGLMLNENCKITIPSSAFDDDVVIEEPFLCQENEPIPLQDRVIHGITFRPYRSAFLPCKISLSEIKKDDIVRLPGCCEYRVIETNSVTK